MQITTKKLLTALGLVVVAFWATPGMADLIANGSFETGAYDSAQFDTVKSSGAQIIDNWTVTAGSVDWIGSYWQPAQGNRSIDMSGTGPGTMASTAFETTPGFTYEITFELAGNPDDAKGIKTLEVSVPGYSQLYYFDTTGYTRANMGWVSETFEFMAQGVSTTLSFESRTDSDYGPALDNVKGSVVPIPGALVLMGAGLVRLVSYGRRKRVLAKHNR